MIWIARKGPGGELGDGLDKQGRAQSKVTAPLSRKVNVLGEERGDPGQQEGPL